MKVRLIALVGAFAATTGSLAVADEGARWRMLAQATAADDGGPDVAAARALLDAWKGEIEILEQARHKLEAAWKVDAKNPAAMREFERYQALRKQMYEIQRKTKGGPAVAEVRKLLDSWSGQPDILERAQRALDRLADSDPYNAWAAIEAARIEMMLGYVSSRYVMNGKFVYKVGNYAPGALSRALQKVGNAARFDPLLAEADLMRAHIAYEMAQLDSADQWLAKAESRGASSPQRHFVGAEVLIARGKFPEAVARVQRALQEGGTDKQTQMRAQAQLAEIYDRTGETEKAVAAHKALVRLDPRDPWARNNYARYLCEVLGRYDEAIVEIRAALEIMDFGTARLILAKALYGKWADFVAEGKPDADTYFEAARKLNPDLDSVMAYGAALPTGQRLAKALMTKGVSVDARTLEGATALLIAANRSRTDTVRFLLGLNANPNIPDQNGWTPLLSAVSEGEAGIVDMLLARGADPKVTLRGVDAASLAERRGYRELAETLRNRAGQK